MRRDVSTILEKINKLVFMLEYLAITNLLFRCLSSTDNIEELEGTLLQVCDVGKK